jgi:hypothetical protein
MASHHFSDWCPNKVERSLFKMNLDKAPIDKLYTDALSAITETTTSAAAIRLIYDGLYALIEGKADPIAKQRFRNFMSKAATFHNERILVALARSDVVIDEKSIDTLITWYRTWLTQIIRTAPTPRHVDLGKRKLQIQEEKMVESKEAKDFDPQAARDAMDDDDGDLQQAEPVVLSISTGVMQDGDGWTFSLLMKAPSDVFDKSAATFPTRELATAEVQTIFKNMNSSTIDPSERQQMWANYIFDVWKDQHAKWSCEDKIGTEWIIFNAYNTVRHYVVVFQTYGPRHLKDNPDYKLLIHECNENTQARKQAWVSLKHYIHSMDVVWQGMKKVFAQNALPGTIMVNKALWFCDKIIICNQNDDAYVAMSALLFQLPANTTDNQARAFDNAMFNMPVS